LSRNKREGRYFGKAKLWKTKIGWLRVTGTVRGHHKRAEVSLKQWHQMCRENQLDWT
jgi:hypothetical protein